MTADFRRLGSDRNSIAINKATGSPSSSPVTYPRVEDITDGEIMRVEWLTALMTPNSTIKVGARKTAALFAGFSANGRRLNSWAIGGEFLLCTLSADGEDGDYAEFWVF